MLDTKQLSDIGFSYVLEKLEPCSPFGEELKRGLKNAFYSDIELLKNEYENIRILSEAIEKDRDAYLAVARALMHFKDVRRSIRRSESATLTDVELFEIKRFLMGAETLADAAKDFPAIEKLGGIRIFRLTEALDIVDPDGMRAQTFRLADCCSDELARIRRERKSVDGALRALPAGSPDRDALAARRTIIAALEENEETRLRAEISAAFSSHAERALELAESIAKLDLALAKAKLMLEHGAVLPRIVPLGESAVEFVDMVNPNTDAILRETGQRFTPVSIEVGTGSTVITGANMGGKSVAVKTLALNTFLARIGMPVFAKSAVVPMVADIHLLSEDAEDSRGGLSSFGGEMVNFNRIITAAEAEEGALVLLDEFARGTNPSEGSALVRAAVRYFEKKRSSFAVITTHFDDVACLAPTHYQVMGLRNANEEELDAALMRAGTAASHRELLARFMDYGLFKAERDMNPPRDALKICRALRISKDFLECVDDKRIR